MTQGGITLDVVMDMTVEVDLDDLLEYVEDRDDDLDTLIERFIEDALDGEDVPLGHSGGRAWFTGEVSHGFIGKRIGKTVVQRAVRKRWREWYGDWLTD